jgi:guanylate kinase
LVKRGTEQPEVIDARLLRASEEALGVGAYDYLIINDTIEECVTEVHSVIQNEHRKVSRNEEFINRMKEELKSFSKGE